MVNWMIGWVLQRAIQIPPPSVMKNLISAFGEKKTALSHLWKLPWLKKVSSLKAIRPSWNGLYPVSD